MTTIRRTATALALAAVFGIPAFASADSVSELCDGNKAEHKEQSTAERTKQNTDRTDQKADDKNKSEEKKPDSNQTGRTS